MAHETARTLPALFSAVAEAAPKAPAVSRAHGRATTYAELATRARTIASALTQTVPAGSRVGIAVADSAAFPEAALGVLEAGCAYVPLDPDYPVERVKFMVDDAEVSVVLVDDEAASAVPSGTPLLQLGSLSPGGAPRGAAAPTEPAYVIYTSGSTGDPKGVVVTQANVLALIRSGKAVFDFNSHDVWTLFHSYSFDFSVWEMWGAFSTGARLVPVETAVRRSPDDFVAVLRDARVTVMNVVPSVFKYIADAYADLDRPQLQVRYVIFGGEALDRTAAAKWVSGVNPRPRLVNMYGITEGTVHSTFTEVDDGELKRLEQPTDMGVPLPHVELRVVDEELREVPDGDAGELLIGGGGVAAGYHNRPALTRSRFLCLSFDGAARRRYYRSGDLTRRRADLGYDYLGRLDDQIKILGFRIEIGEIEAALRELPGVVDAAVDTVSGPQGVPVLIALYVSAANTASALRKALAERLPAHMVPAQFIRVDAIPLAPSGKRDRRALAAALKRSNQLGSNAGGASGGG